MTFQQKQSQKQSSTTRQRLSFCCSLLAYTHTEKCKPSTLLLLVRYARRSRHSKRLKDQLTNKKKRQCYIYSILYQWQHRSSRAQLTQLSTICHVVFFLPKTTSRRHLPRISIATSFFKLKVKVGGGQFHSFFNLPTCKNWPSSLSPWDFSYRNSSHNLRPGLTVHRLTTRTF